MKAVLSYALAACALVSSTAAVPSPPARAIQRRNDAPPLPPCPSTNYKPFTYVGCFYEPNPETLQYNPNLVFSTMTVETCAATCKSNGFKYAGLIYYGNCLCGTMLPPPAPETDCTYPCNGDPSEICGADRRFSIYQDPTYPTVDLTTIVSDYTLLDCYTDGNTFHALPYRQDQLDASSLTTEECLSACGNEYYPLAGTEYGGECYCGAMLQGGTVPSPGSCTMPCTGNANEICGGPALIDVYEAKILESTQPCGSGPPPPPATCSGTAYGYATSTGATDKTFISLGIGHNWGWVISGAPPISGLLYLGAGGNDITKATVVGSFTIAHTGSNLVVTYTTTAGWYLSSTHFYYGATYPSKIAPGQFGNTHTPPTGTTTDTFTIPYSSSKSTYIVHAGIAYSCPSLPKA